ncbi:hypothetical protein [Okeania sp. SIO1I7]|uniref:hypothetical protein n=1 Tax=Okeania sp. SIO1I7 TaxID=2607772 RepID=UPI0025F7963F|nr:hypothetical protein [Okeania sp. SIO1I7]
MKITQITIIFLLACLTVVVGEIKQAIANPNLLVTTETEKAKPIPVSLPVIAVVKLKDGDRRTGAVVGVNSQHITIKRGQSSGKENITNVTRINFNDWKGFWWPTSDGIIVMRGDEVEKTGNIRRFEVGVDGLVWENAEKNAIEIKPESVIRVDDKEGVPRSMWNIINSRYVVSEMEFEPERQIWIITARLQSKKE